MFQEARMSTTVFIMDPLLATLRRKAFAVSGLLFLDLRYWIPVTNVHVDYELRVLDQITGSLLKGTSQ
jgi:hypothetical protein